MTPASNDPHRELDRLCARVADGLASEEEVQALDARLSASVEACRRYLAWMRLHHDLQARAARAAAPVPSLAALPPVRVAPGAARAKRWRSLGKIAAAFVMGGLGVLALDHAFFQPAARPEQKTAAASTLAAPIAQVAAQRGAVWTLDGQEPGATREVRPGALHLTAGELTLAYPSGVELTLQAPLRARLTDEAHVFVTEGDLAARVPESAAGFVVEMPGAALLDLGTSFAVKVRPGGPAEMLVREGRVMATLLDAAGASRREYLASAGEVVAIDPAAQVLEKRAPQGGGATFLEPRGLPFPPLPVGEAYAAAIRASAPRVWWRFDAPAGQPVPNEAGGDFSLQPFGAPERAEAEGNAWTEFSGETEAGWALAEPLPGLNTAAGYTLELWLRADIERHATVLGLLEAAAPWPELSVPPEPGQPARVRQDYLSVIESVGAANSAAGMRHPMQRLRYLHRSPPGRATGTNLFTAAPYRLRQWHHVAAVCDGQELRLYLDGQLSSREAASGPHGGEAFHVLLGRQRPAGFAHDARPWTGGLDEAAIYERPLAAEEIRAHYDAAPAAHFKPSLAWQSPR